MFRLSLFSLYLLTIFISAVKRKSTSKVSAQPENSVSVSNTPQPAHVPSPEETVPDPYEAYLAEQQQQEEIWRVMRAAKRQRVDDAPAENVTTSISPSVPSVPVAVPVAETNTVGTHELTAKLHSKTEECEQLKRKVEELKENNGVIEKSQRTLQENVCKVSNSPN